MQEGAKGQNLEVIHFNIMATDRFNIILVEDSPGAQTFALVWMPSDHARLPPPKRRTIAAPQNIHLPVARRRRRRRRPDALARGSADSLADRTGVGSILFVRRRRRRRRVPCEVGELCEATVVRALHDGCRACRSVSNSRDF
jgi:hypothetical protein